jgi:hypothetical protein
MLVFIAFGLKCLVFAGGFFLAEERAFFGGGVSVSFWRWAFVLLFGYGLRVFLATGCVLYSVMDCAFFWRWVECEARNPSPG